MGNIAVIYATGMTKHTKKAAEYIASNLGADIFNLKDLAVLNLTDYETIVFGTGVHAGKPYKQVVEFIANNEASLKDKRKHLFIECKYDAEKGQAQCDKIAEQLGIKDAVFFTGKDECNDEGMPVAMDEFITRLKFQ